MLKKVNIHWDNLDESTWKNHETDDVLKLLTQEFGEKFPDSARIYHGSVSQLTDVTPHDESSIEKLAALEGEFFVIVYPEGAALPYVIMLVISVAVTMLMPKPPTPAMPPALNRNQQSSSPNNDLSDRSNRARINGRIPDIYGTVRATPDLIAAPYKIFENNREVEYAHMCIGRGAYEVWDIRDGETNIEFIAEAALAIYPPYVSVNSYDPANPTENAPQLVIGNVPRVPMLNTKRCNSVNGQVLRPPVDVLFSWQSPVRFVYPDRIEIPAASWADFTAFFASGDIITVSDAIVVGGTQVLNINVQAAYQDVVYSYPGGSHVFDVGDGALLFPAELKDTLDQIFIPAANVTFTTNSITMLGDISGTYTVVSAGIDGPLNPTEVQNGVPSYYIVKLNSPHSENSNWITIGSTVPTYQAAITYTAGFAFDLDGEYSVNSVSKNVIVLNNPDATNSDWDDVLSIHIATNFINVEIASSGDRWIGPFVLDGNTNTEVFSNFFAQNGLYRDTGGDQVALNVVVEIELTPVDSDNEPLADPQYFSIGLLGSDYLKESVGVTLMARPIGFYGRMLIRARRVTPAVEDEGTVVDEVRWKDVYSVAPVNVNNFGNVTTIFSVTPATASALAVKDRKLNMLVQRKIPEWNGTAFSTELVGTNDAAAILSAICLDRYIGNRNIVELDVQNFYDTCDEIETYFGTAKAREFSYTFDKETLSFEEMVGSVVSAIFCVAYRRGNIIKINFERETELSTLLFNHRNKIPKSEQRTFSFGYANNDGIKYTYVDPADDSVNTIFLPEGYAAISPKTIESVGVRDHLQAYFHAWRAWNKLRYQNTVVEFEATQESDLLVRNDRILVSDGTRPNSQEGEVLAVDGTLLTLSQKVDLTVYADYSIFLQLSDGTVESIPITAGANPNQVILEDPPSLPLVTDPENYAKTTYIIAGDTQEKQAFLVTERTRAGKMTSTVTAVNYDQRYYANDLDFVNEIIGENGYGETGGFTPGEGSGFPVTFLFVSAPLTYDEFLSDDVTALTVGGSGPHITNLGFKGNGIDSLYYYDAMPSWADGDSLYLQASITPLLPTRETTYLRDVIVSVGNTTPKLQFSVLQDPVNTAWLNVGFRGRNETANESHPYVRRDWKYHGRYPVLSAGGYDARPQSICFNVSDDGYTCVAHYEDQDSIFHVVDENGGLVDSYSFGSASHFSSLARDQGGRLWALDYATGYLYRINEAASVSTGTFTADITYNASAITGAGAIEFITYSGTDYLLIAQYLTTGTPYLYAVVATEFTNGGTLTLAERFKRFVIQFRCQGLAVSSFTGSTLYISSNRINAESAFGRIYTVNISSAMAGSDGATLSIVNLYQAPSQYPEDIDFDSAGRLWTLTEGQSSVGDKDGFLSIWSTNFTPQENHYSAYYNGSSVTVKVNNFVFETFDFVSGAVSASRLEIGGPIASIAGPGWENGYFAGYLRNIFVSNADASSETYQNVIDGEYEPNTLTVVNLTLTNPGAESGTTGWTNETGSIATRSTNPTPYDGSAYFSGGSNAQTISRQSIDILSASGLLQSELNAKTAWVNLQWYQASFGGTDTDLCGMGLSFTNGGVETDRDYSSLINIPEDQVWCIRSFAKQVAADDDAVRIIYRSDRSSGTNNDGYVDSISAVLYYK